MRIEVNYQCPKIGYPDKELDRAIIKAMKDIGCRLGMRKTDLYHGKRDICFDYEPAKCTSIPYSCMVV